MSWHTFRCFVFDVQTDAGWYLKRSYGCCHILSHSLRNHHVIRRCKTWINKDSLKTQRIGHHNQFTIRRSSMGIPICLLIPSLSGPLESLSFLISDARSSLSAAFCRHLLIFFSRRSFFRTSSHLDLGLFRLLLLSGLPSDTLLTLLPWSILTTCPIRSSILL